MATTHVFIVDKDTFRVHLKYLFAGTGAGTDDIDFNNSSTTSLSYGKENKLASMSADASRIRRGDRIIFYLQQNISEGIPEGQFFGVFIARNDWSFIDRNNGQQYLLGGTLNKSLVFRTLIEPETVYPCGVSEWEALDAINGMSSPNQMLWSLIYRKLKGNRGNTMITIYESERLCQQIRNKNNAIPLIINNVGLDFNISNQQIILSNNLNDYSGDSSNVINMLPRLLNKYSNNRAFESHLQSYIVKNIGKISDSSLNNAIFGDSYEIEWLGNEVSCGVGMQRIDIAISANINNQRVFFPIELKAVEASIDNIRQIKRYLDWIEQYYIPNRQSDISPIIIAKEFGNKRSQVYLDILQVFGNFNIQNNTRCLPIKYIEYSVVNNNLIFNNVTY